MAARQRPRRWRRLQCRRRRSSSRMSTVAHPSVESREAAATRVAAALRSEVGVFRLALAVVALHILDENYLQPEPGTSPGDHLASGLVPIAVLTAAAVIYPRLRSGVRAMTAMTLGGIAITVGIPAVYFALDGDASGDH